METWNLAKIEVVEEDKVYNFDFGRKLIWDSDHEEKRAQIPAMFK